LREKLEQTIDEKGSLLDTYKAYLHPDVLDYESPKMWQMIGNNDIIDLFQFETDIGLSAAKLIKPTNLVELATANSLMRLMGGKNKQPLDEYREYKKNLDLWYQEMKMAGLNTEEMLVLEKHLKKLYGIADTQETVMEMAMDPKIGNLDLTEANKLRKAIGKKSEKVMKESKKEFFEKGSAANTSQALLNYVKSKCILTPSFSVLTPLPGTELYNEKKEQIKVSSFELFDLLHAVLPTKLSLEQFYKEYANLWRKSYSRYLPKVSFDAAKEFISKPPMIIHSLKLLGHVKALFKAENYMLDHQKLQEEPE